MRPSPILVVTLGLTLAISAAAANLSNTLPASVHYDESRLSQASYTVEVQNNVEVPMRDGTRLATDIYRPRAQGQFPTLLWRTPYGKYDAPSVEQSMWFAARGYVVVAQDVRGRYDSGGAYTPFAAEVNDGYDTDEWIGHQPWSNGKIGTMGGSYLGYTQIAEGIAGSPYLKAMSGSVTTSDVVNNWVYIDGALFTGFAVPWGAIEMDGHISQFTRGIDWPVAFRHLPVDTMDAAAGHTTDFYRAWLAHTRANDPFWKGISLENQVQDIGVPFLEIDGWYNLFLRGALDDDAKIRAHGRTELARTGKHILIGPWAHNTGVRNNAPGSVITGPDRSIDFGPAAQVDLRNVYLRWQDHWLKGIDNGVDREPPVKIFVMGANYWRYENEWPLARTHYTDYYIGSAGRANSAAGDGVLSTVPPGKGASAATASDHFIYDPADPVPTLGGNTCCSSVPHGPWDQRKDEIRTDVLVYTTPVLTEPVEVTGPITMMLYAATTARDTDWTAKLVDVWPDGYAQNIQDGILRARYRRGKIAPASLLEPGKVYEYTIDLWATSNVFLAGHRIRLEVASSNFPRFDRNLNTGEDPFSSTRLETARQTIYHSERYPSHLVLPIIPGAAAAMTAAHR